MNESFYFRVIKNWPLKARLVLRTRELKKIMDQWAAGEYTV